MSRNPTRSDWFFPIEEVPVFAAITRDGEKNCVSALHKKALIATDTGNIVGVVGESCRVFTNQQAVELCRQFCRDAFPDTTAAEWIYKSGHGPSTRSWAAMDIRHHSHTMNLMGLQGGPSTPFARITNSYNGTRALRIDVGFMRHHCEKG